MPGWRSLGQGEQRRQSGLGGTRVILLWMGLLFAFSPVLVNLVTEAAAYGVRANLVVTPILFVLAITLRSEVRRARVGVGFAVLSLSLALGILGVAGGSWSLARCGLPLGVIGMAFVTGRPDFMVAVLTLWLVPIPTFLLLPTTPWAETEIARWAASPFALFGFEVEASGSAIISGSERILLYPSDTGLSLAVLFSELGWYSAVREYRSVSCGARRALLGIVIAVPVQIVGFMLGIVFLLAGASNFGRLWLTHGVWLVAAFAGLAWVEWRIARGRGSREDPQVEVDGDHARAK